MVKELNDILGTMRIAANTGSGILTILYDRIGNCTLP
jgi:hypothetical protein